VAARLLHAPLQEKSVDTVDLEWLPPFFLSSPAVTCKQQEKNATCSRVYFFFSLFSDLHLFSFFLWVSSSSPLLRVAVSKEEAWDLVAGLQAVL
jgi:hypothetical protein